MEKNRRVRQDVQAKRPTPWTRKGLASECALNCDGIVYRCMATTTTEQSDTLPALIYRYLHKKKKKGCVGIYM